MITIRTATPTRRKAATEPEDLFDVRHDKGGYAVFKGATRVSRRFSMMATAIAQANHLEEKAKLTERKCICCTTTFLSSGPGHRMCDTCRSLATGMA